MIPVLDGHNDFLQRMVAAGPNRDALWLKGDGTGNLDLPRMKKGGFAGGFFAIWTPMAENDIPGGYKAAMSAPPYSVPLPRPIPLPEALPHGFEQAAQLMAMERAGGLKICRSAADIRMAMQSGDIAAIMHMEGAEPIRDIDALHAWHAMGLRSLGPVWSRSTVWGHGVPFAFPSSPDTGDGLTDMGKDLVRECNRLRIMLDLSHLNEKGFDDIARLSDAPLVASHSNVHAICPSSRNLTDRQLDIIRDSQGLVGLNYAVNFLVEDGDRHPFTGFAPMLRHLDYLIDRLGENGVALGSDYDGATMPVDLEDVGNLQSLIIAMKDHGYGDDLIRKIAHENWIGLLDRTWGA